MSRRTPVSIVAQLALLLLSAQVSPCLAMPELTITRTHLMKDVEKATAVIGGGFDVAVPDDGYLGDILFGYCGYAPTDWLEVGLGVHAGIGSLVPAVEVTFDALDAFSRIERLSLLIVGGIGGWPGGEVSSLHYHAGAALNYRLNPHLQLYAGAGGDSASQALVAQAGVYVAPLRWLGISTGLGLVHGAEGTAALLCLTPMLVLRR